jgi:hypothetical protein
VNGAEIKNFAVVFLVDIFNRLVRADSPVKMSAPHTPNLAVARSRSDGGYGGNSGRTLVSPGGWPLQAERDQWRRSDIDR